MGNVLICNAPMLFSGVWKVAKQFLDEKTRAKIMIKGSNYMDTLTTFVDIENVPTFMGGQCTCADKGGCMNSNIGPWNEFEIDAENYTIKPKNGSSSKAITNGSAAAT